ncbi:hypothetical protein V6N13_118338 [Hibiscus sabdariffa]
MLKVIFALGLAEGHLMKKCAKGGCSINKVGSLKADLMLGKECSYGAKYVNKSHVSSKDVDVEVAQCVGADVPVPGIVCDNALEPLGSKVADSFQPITDVREAVDTIGFDETSFR